MKLQNQHWNWNYYYINNKHLYVLKKTKSLENELMVAGFGGEMEERNS